MYCQECKCEFMGWNSKCPECNGPLVEEFHHAIPDVDQKISYDELVNLASANNGDFQIELSTTSVGKERKWKFPYNGYGYAWTRKMSSVSNGIPVNLTTSEVGRSNSWKFPYLGYGFAWAKSMEGSFGGTELALHATKVSREKKWRFPYLGYGRAWTEEMCGELGEQLCVQLSITKVGKGKDWRFPYRGYGFAWIRKAVLTLSLNK